MTYKSDLSFPLFYLTVWAVREHHRLQASQPQSCQETMEGLHWTPHLFQVILLISYRFQVVLFSSFTFHLPNTQQSCWPLSAWEISGRLTWIVRSKASNGMSSLAPGVECLRECLSIFVLCLDLCPHALILWFMCSLKPLTLLFKHTLKFAPRLCQTVGLFRSDAVSLFQTMEPLDWCSANRAMGILESCRDWRKCW